MTDYVSFDSITRPSDPSAFSQVLIDLLESGSRDQNGQDHEPLVIYYNTDEQIDCNSAPSAPWTELLRFYWEQYNDCLLSTPEDDSPMIPQIKVSMTGGIYNIYAESYPSEDATLTFKIHPSRKTVLEFFVFMDNEGIDCYDCNMKYFQ